MTSIWDCIGGRHCQDAEISISLVLEMKKRLEARYTSAVESKEFLETLCAADTGSFFILAYCVSLRGFETPNIVLIYLKKQTLSPSESQ